MHATEAPEATVVGSPGNGGGAVVVRWPAGTPETATFYSYWLRLYADESELYRGVAERWMDGANFGRNLDDDDTSIVEAGITADGALVVVWSDGQRRAITLDWLRWMAVAADPVLRIQRIPWDGSDRFEFSDFARLLSDDTYLIGFLERFLAYGLAFVSGAPRHKRAVVELANRLGTLEPSHLGETFDVLFHHSPDHIGETADAIPLHIDFAYKQTPPRIQMLHAFRQVDSGGENVFVDALRVLAELDPADSQWLRTTPLWFVAESETVHFRGLHPILAYGYDGELVGVHYNEYKIVFPANADPAVHRAFRRFQRLIVRSDLQQAVVIPQDGIVVLDNRRTLHGRRAFAGRDRHLIGCFVIDDDLRSRYRTLVAQRSGERP